MQKIALINPSQNTKHPQPPMGLALLGGILEEKGYEVCTLDFNVQPEYSTLAKAIMADVVGITAMTPTINNALKIAQLLKHYNPSLGIILGGVHATLLPLETLKASEGTIDIVVAGEGDYAFSEILRSNIRGDTTSVYHSKGEIDMDSLPYLAYHLLPWRSYKPHPPHGRIIYLNYSSLQPFNCFNILFIKHCSNIYPMSTQSN